MTALHFFDGDIRAERTVHANAPNGLDWPLFQGVRPLPHFVAANGQYIFLCPLNFGRPRRPHHPRSPPASIVAGHRRPTLSDATGRRRCRSRHTRSCRHPPVPRPRFTNRWLSCSTQCACLSGARAPTSSASALHPSVHYSRQERLRAAVPSSLPASSSLLPLTISVLFVSPDGGQPRRPVPHVPVPRLSCSSSSWERRRAMRGGPRGWAFCAP